MQLTHAAPPILDKPVVKLKPHQGLTLIELMITVAIVAILAAIAYPSYSRQILRSHRTDAKSALLQIQVAQEKYFLQNNAYGSLTNLGLPSTTTNGYYTVSLTTLTSTTYVAQAVATGGQAADTTCATYTINQAGATTPAVSTGCWK